jgi:REP element-mobilizing transposase RayT
MAQSLAQLYTHLIFSTKERIPILHSNEHEPLREYLGGIFRELECPVIAIGVEKDHVHCVYRHSKNIALAKVVEKVKIGSSKWLKTKGERYASFHWQNGYGAFSLSASKLDVVKQYVLNQAEHHKTVSFQEEYRRFLKKYNIEFDERYVWD